MFKKLSTLITAPILSILVLINISQSHASITEQGRGMLFGNDHSFTFTAADGWVLDNESGVNQGLHMVFYPKENNWQSSPIIAYGRSLSAKNGNTINSIVSTTVDDFKNNGSPNYKSEKQKEIQLTNGVKASVYYFSGDQWGNYEAVAYFQEKETINFLVYNSRTKAQFDMHLDSFYKIVHTYENQLINEPIDGKVLNALNKEANLDISLPEGKEYETQAVKMNGQAISNTLKQCTSSAKNKQNISFNYFVRINQKGDISESFIAPLDGLTTCFKRLMSRVNYPMHNFEDFLLKVNIKIEP